MDTHVVGLALFFDGVVVGVEVEEDGREEAMAVSGKEADAMLAASRVHLTLICKGHTSDTDQIEELDPAVVVEKSMMHMHTKLPRY